MAVGLKFSKLNVLVDLIAVSFLFHQLKYFLKNDHILFYEIFKILNSVM